jgi:hypothetical protein
MTRGSAMHAVLIALGFALTMASCGEDPGPEQTSTPTASSPSTSPSASETRWIAVIDVAPDPSDLDALTQRLLGPLGTALVVAPTDCFKGLPDAAANGYLIGAVANSRSEVERRVVEAGEQVAFSAHVTITCTD